MGRPERTLPAATWFLLLVVAIGLGLTAAAGVISDGGGRSASDAADVLPTALIGASVALAIGAVAVRALRDRAAVQAIGTLAALIVFAAAGALIAISASAEPSVDAPAAITDDSTGDPTVGGGPARAGGPAGAASEPRDRRDITDFQGSIVLAGGLVLLALAMVFFMRRSELRAVERSAVYLRSDLVLEDDQPEQVPDEATMAAALSRSLDELLNESDPRLAIRAAYGSLLNELAEAGIERYRYEAPNEHIRRCLSAHPMPAGSITDLVELFEIARFSEHEVTRNDAERARRALTDAIDALGAVTA